MVNPVWLKTFITLVEQKHFTRTAEQLNMTQPGVSQHIRKLESYYDTPLISRFDKSFELTPAGEQVHRFAREQLSREQALREQLKKDDPHQGDCRFSSPGALALRLYPKLVELQQEYPLLNMHFEVAPNHRIQTELLNNHTDVGLMTRMPDNLSLVSVPVGKERLCLAIPASTTINTFAELMTLGMISHPDAGHHVSLVLQENFAEFQHISDVPVKGYINQINMILEPVAASCGFTVLPASVIGAYSKKDSIKLMSLDKEVHETVYQVYRRHKPLPDRYRFLLESLFE